MRKATNNEIADIYDKYVGGRRARTLPMETVMSWAAMREDLFSVDKEDYIWIREEEGDVMPEGWDNKYVDELGEGENTMKYGTVGVLHGQRGPFTYRVPDSDDDEFVVRHRDLSPGDHVIVKNRFGYSVGEVIEVHPEPEDERDDITYAWVFDKVDEQEWERVMDAATDAGL